MLATTLAADPFLGRLLTGRIESGARPDRPDGARARPRRAARSSASASRRILAFRGLDRASRSTAPRPATSSASPACRKATVADTIADPSRSPRAIPAQPIDPPTISVTFVINDSPARRPRRRQGAEPGHPRAADARGRDRTSRSRSADTPGGEAFEVSGRGELQMGVLIENMRREGFELSVSPAAGALPRGGRRAARADRGGDRRRRRGVRRRRRRQALPAQGRARRDAHRRGRQDPHRRARALARADRLPRRVPDRHPRHRRAEPGLPRLGALQGRRSPAAATAC